MFKVLSKIFFIGLFLISWFPEIFGQPVLPSDLKKPKKYENKLLGSEKSADKKFTLTRKFIQNTVTHYNWYFNANNKLNAVIERAKLAHKDDYGALLSFYNYSLETTAGEKTELDSVIYKANSGILIHDLRNSWMDNLFMLIGKAYYLKNDLDSAYITFQYINYAFSPKDDGYDLPIGSNANEGGNVLSVSTKENNKLAHRLLTMPPDRNESFIWQIRTWIMKDALPEAASMIQTLKNDPVFPERLQNDLNEVQALWFYQQKRYDSTAYYLEKALGNAENKKETARWEYLIAQLYERAKMRDQARDFYDRAIQHTLDPVLEVYARLNSIRQNKSDSNAIKKNIAQLLKMGRRDRYSRYRDIVYYTAAQIELDRDNVPGARAMLLKSTAASANSLNPAQRTRSFLLLADLYFEDKMYAEAKRNYDSVNNNDPGVLDPTALDQRKEVLQDIVTQTDVIHRQDSLQYLAGLPPAQRNAILKKMVRQMRKKQGLKEEENVPGNAAVGMNNRNTPAVDLFQTDEKSDWYFANPALKSKGYTSFKSTWGNRPNVDNWRRQAAISQNNALDQRNPEAKNGQVGQFGDSATSELTVESLLKTLPLLPDQLQLSKDSVGNSMLQLGKIFVNKLEDYPTAIKYLENFVDSFEYSSQIPEALYYLYFAYLKVGRSDLADKAKQTINRKYEGSPFQVRLTDALTGAGSKTKTEATKEYDKIYNLFIEGSFDSALAQKSIMDSIYGSSYWTPQLLYIEGIYHIHRKQDQQAKTVLQKIIDLYPGEPLAKKVQTLLDVLSRRREIEDYLTKLEIKRVEDTVFVAKEPPPVAKNPPLKRVQDSTTLRPVNPNPYLIKPKADSLAKAPAKDSVKTAPPSDYAFNMETPHDVVIILNKVDPVYVTESKNAFNRYNKEKYYNKTIDITIDNLNDTSKMVIMSGFENASEAMEYLGKARAVASTQIIPWLPSAKYTMYVISPTNIEVLKNKNDLNEYRKFHERYSSGARPEPH